MGVISEHFGQSEIGKLRKSRGGAVNQAVVKAGFLKLEYFNGK